MSANEAASDAGSRISRPTSAEPAASHDNHEVDTSSPQEADAHTVKVDSGVTAIKVEDEVAANAAFSINIPPSDDASVLLPDALPNGHAGDEDVDMLHGTQDTKQAHGKKRKRVSSPPWQFPTVERASVKSSNGRRISARVNTGTPVQDDTEDGARSSSLSTVPPLRSRPPSPPWKRFGAEGPAAVVVDGKRMSGRVNKELTKTPKRVSPRSKARAVGRTAVVAQNATTTTTTMTNGTSRNLHDRKPSGGVRPSSSSSTSDSMLKIKELQAQIAALKPTRSFVSPPPRTLKRGYKRKRGEEEPSRPTGTDTPDRRSHRHLPGRETASPKIGVKPSPKLKLRFNAARHMIPPPHPNAKLPSPSRPPSLSVHQIVDMYELKEMQQSYSENERGPPDLAWFLQRAAKQAEEEGQMRLKILEEAKPDGKLSREKSKLFQDADQQREPPKQYGHADHLLAHVLHLRHLQLREKTHHRTLAKRVAHDALEMWKARRGPSEEDLRAEEDRNFKLIYRQCVADVKAKWDLVAAHVYGLRVKEWEAAEEVRRQRRLQEKLEWSENMVARQRGEAEDTSDMSDTEDSGEMSESSGEENMSDSASATSEGEVSAEEEGEMEEEDLKAYLAQREAETPEVRMDEQGEGSDSQSFDDEDLEQPMPIAGPRSSSSDTGSQAELRDLAVADLYEDDARKSEHNESDGEFQPASADVDVATVTTIAKDGHDSPTPQNLVSDEYATRARRSSVASVEDIDNMGDDNLSDDESTDMDSEDYDSDEDMSSTGDENDASDDGSDDDGSDDDAGSGDETEVQIRKNPLLSLFKDELRPTGLPTPTTSAEGDEREAESHAEGAVAENSDESMHEISEQQHDVEVGDHDGILRQDATVTGVAVQNAGLEIDEEFVVDAAPPSISLESADDSGAKHLVPQPALLRGSLRSYQHAGLDWLASLYRNGTNGILADEMGLGKTIQTIALLAHLAEEHEVWEAHLVIVPTSVILNWVTEFQKFLPGFRVLGYYGSAEERQAKRRGWVNDPHHEQKDKRGYNVVVTSYNVAMQDINAIRNVQWHYLVLDEAHNIRNFNSQRWQVLIRLKTRGRLLLTGTPLQNSLTELWSLLTFLTAGDDDPAHGDLEEFLSHWKEPVKEIFDRGVVTLSSEAQKVVDQLHISLRPFLLRRLKSEVEKDLPRKTEEVVVCKLSKRQRQLYQDYMGLAETRRSLVQGNAVSAGKVLLSLRRVCNHPDLFDPRPIQTSWAMETSAVEIYDVRMAAVRSLLGSQRSVPEMLIAVRHEGKSKHITRRIKQLKANSLLAKEVKELEDSLRAASEANASTVAGVRVMQRVRQREQRLEQLRSTIRLLDESTSDSPVYGSDLRELLTIQHDRAYKVKVIPPKPPHNPYGRPLPPQPVVKSLRGWPALGSRPLGFSGEHPSDWMVVKSSMLQTIVQTREDYAERMRDLIVRFAFVTPTVTAPVLGFSIPSRVQELLRAESAYALDTLDYGHEARVRMSIAFPDSRLLIFDSGKLQQLTHLLRTLQSQNSRSLIFTQMTGTLNILEQFLSLLNLPYLRLDGSTPPERRQMYAAEFNRPDSKYQCMILSSRAGGVGLNLTGASSVIFYDLDWNPQMDRQCMDRAHRIGQVRDVRVFKLVSEKTVEENILRRAEQKSLLDQTVIQNGHFTTEYQSNLKPLDTEADEGQDDVAAAIERFLGGANANEKATTQALESVEDKEDVAAAQAARKEEHQDDADFADRSSKNPSTRATPGVFGESGGDGPEEAEAHLDGFLVKMMHWLVQDVPFVPPLKQVRRLDKNGRDPSHRKRKR